MSAKQNEGAGAPGGARTNSLIEQAVGSGGRGEFIDSLMDTDLYSIGAYFSDQHPELVDEVVARSAEIEQAGLEAYARRGGTTVEEAFETLLTGLAVRYYKAVAG